MEVQVKYLKHYSFLFFPNNSERGITEENYGWIPNVDILRVKGGIYIIVELAGVQRSEIQIELHNRSLIIKGHRKKFIPDEECDYYSMEIDDGRFGRKINIPYNIIVEKIKVGIENGILKIFIPKALEISKRIEIE